MLILLGCLIHFNGVAGDFYGACVVFRTEIFTFFCPSLIFICKSAFFTNIVCSIVSNCLFYHVSIEKQAVTKAFRFSALQPSELVQGIF
ncbi:hypothetical protein DRO69_07405 [Candidatus Bathyarchaeota archaeon]|nr:MAG: hypothetical protein DRO69_07405 [Candidatus Bathyarchaeota archaeon]